MTDPVRDHVRKILDTTAADRARRDAETRRLEAAGHRIVAGGQTGTYGDDAQADWEVTDWRTGEVLAAGRGGYEDYVAAVARLDPDGRFVDIDRVGGSPTPTPNTDGVPASLAEALEDWVGSLGTPLLEIAEFVGWPVERVQRVR